MVVMCGSVVVWLCRMGAYRSQPERSTESEDARSERLTFGASSMQGWRVSQEVPHTLPLASTLTHYSFRYSLFSALCAHGNDISIPRH